MNARTMIALTGLSLTLLAGAASGTNYGVNWMQMAPTAFGSAPPFSGTYNLPGIGSVLMTYTADADFAEARLSVPQLSTGSVTSGSDTYGWTSQECLARTNWAYSGALNTSWSVTYTFSSAIPANQLVLGVQGLGRRNPNPGEVPAACTTLCTVQQNGTHLGDFTGAMNVGPTQFTSGAGTFSMINSLTGAGGNDPWWNTGLAVVLINDSVSSLTVHFDQTAGDGVGVNIGSLRVPAPGSLALVGMGGLMAARRRR